MSGRGHDLIIIGAGSVGTPLAWRLAEAGCRVLVLDRGASVGQGSNKTAIGGIRATHSDPAKIRIGLESLEVFRSWEDRFGDDIGWRQGGYSFVAYRRREEQILKKLLRQQRAAGLEIDWHDGADLREIVPALKGEGLIGGTYSPGDGTASPLLSALAFEKQARRFGAEFKYREPVTELLRRGDRIEGVRTDRDLYYAPIVVNAAGASAAEIGRLAGMELPVSPESHEAGITEPVAPFLGPMIVDIQPGPGSKNFYFCQIHTGQVIFCVTPDPPMVGVDRRETSGFLPLVARRMLTIMPSLQNLRVRRTWRGLYPMTPDGAPIVGPAPGLEGFFLAVGMCGQGYMLGPGLAVYLARQIMGEGESLGAKALEMLAPDRAFAGQEALR